MLGGVRPVAKPRANSLDFGAALRMDVIHYSTDLKEPHIVRVELLKGVARSKTDGNDNTGSKQVKLFARVVLPT